MRLLLLFVDIKEIERTTYLFLWTCADRAPVRRRSGLLSLRSGPLRRVR